MAVLSNHLAAACFMPHLATAAHTAGTAHQGLFLVLPLVVLCAVMVPVAEDLFHADFRSRLGGVFVQGQTIEDLKVHSMRRRPGSRHVFSYKLVLGNQSTGKQSSIELVGKRDTTQATGKAAREFEAMQMLWNAGFGLDERFRIPRPLHHFPDLKLIVQEKARGAKLRTYLGQGRDVSFDHARNAGRWLAKLHNIKVSPFQVSTYEKEISSLRMFASEVGKDQPQLAADLQQHAAAVEHRFASFRDVPTTLVHGDFHPDHIFVDGDIVTVIDFERFCVGDPARDLGSFIAHMRMTACFTGRTLTAVNREIDAFLGSYFRALTLAQGMAIAPRIASFEALSYIEALYYVASVLKVTAAAPIAMYTKCVQMSGLDLKVAAHSSTNARAASAQRAGS